ncbi:RNA polymerase sigma factor [Lentibacillus cibarius]|uniref:Sigma-70 family RNA polymerase sigma factor n=1 Tax=Lentibacillus cibarius TaxID=2583219 RepID=A0A5S3QLZ6_9BACI|nr:RNA polymerase sigma factor [Lentibacillus cibarius]TMN22974.1 sigma-70 family RNA polymerase sigma factor [Lentibacillus cibarius]
MKKNKLDDQVISFILDNKNSFYRLAFSYVKNTEDALDIVQDSIEKALLNKHSIKDKQSIKSWFYKIVVHSSLDHLRKNKKLSFIDNDTFDTFYPARNDNCPDIDLERSIDELPVSLKSIIVLRYFEDLKIKEIADILEENKSTIKTRLYKTLKLLRLKMDDVQE